MTLRPGTGRVVLLGAGMGILLLLLQVGEARTPLGGAAALVSLVPVGLAVALGGPVAAGLAIGVGLGGASLLLGGSAPVVMALRHAVPGLVLGMALVRRLPLAVALVGVTGMSLLGLMALVVLYVPAGTGVLPALSRDVQSQVADLERWSARMGLSGESGGMIESAQMAASLMRVVAPALLIVGLLLVALLNYLVARVCFRGLGFRPFAEEAVPDHLVWGVITGGLLLLSRHEVAELVGLNLLSVFVPIYAIQGLAVLRHFFLRVRVPRPLQGVGFGLFVIQPILLLAVACLGLLDLWVDFRKIRQAPTPA